MAPKNVILSSSAPPSVVAVDRERLYGITLAVGVGFGLVMLFNMIVLWWAPRFGEPAWELTTVGQTFDRLPLIILSLVLVGISAALADWIPVIRAVSTTCILVAVGIAALAVLYGLAAVEIRGTVNPDLELPFKLAAVKTALVSLVYFGLFLTMAFLFSKTVTSCSPSRKHLFARDRSDPAVEPVEPGESIIPSASNSPTPEVVS